MFERFLELQPAVYAALMSKDIRTKETDVATFNEDDITLAEDIMTVLTPLRTVTMALCSELMPTASLMLPLQKKLLTIILVVKDTNPPVVQQLKNEISDDLTPR